MARRAAIDPATPSGAELVRLRQQSVPWKDIYRLFPNTSPSTLRKRASRASRAGLESPEETSATISGAVHTRITSLPDLVSLFNIDLDLYEITGLKFNTYEQHSVKRGLITLYQVYALLKPRSAPPPNKLLAALRAELATAPPPLDLPKPKTTRSPLALTLNMPDLHLGKLAEQPYQPNTYNPETAETLYLTALDNLLAQVAHLELDEVWLPTGNDLLHIDNNQGTTTKGTPVLPTASYMRLWSMAHNLIRTAVQIVSERQPTAAIKIPIVPGNHDNLAVYTLGQALSDLWSNSERVTVIPHAAPRLYLTYGANLIAYAHGNQIKPTALAELMPAEAPMLWAQTRHREWHLGHYHAERVWERTIANDIAAILFRVLPSISAKDAWTHNSGLIGNRAATALLYHKEKGHQASFYHRP